MINIQFSLGRFSQGSILKLRICPSDMASCPLDQSCCNPSHNPTCYHNVAWPFGKYFVFPGHWILSWFGVSSSYFQDQHCSTKPTFLLKILSNIRFHFFQPSLYNLNTPLLKNVNLPARSMVQESCFDLFSYVDVNWLSSLPLHSLLSLIDTTI